MNGKMKFFARLGEDYCRAYLSRFDWEKMKNDRVYGLKAFLYGWAYERNGAPRGWKIAAVKAVVDKEREDMEEVFNEYYPPRDESSNNNKERNPCMHNGIREIDIPDICAMIEDGKFKDAFDSLGNVNGLKSHKLRAFFLRDLTVMLGREPDTTEDLLFLQPMDVWLRKTIDILWGESEERTPKGYRSIYCFESGTYNRAKKLIEASKKAGVSSLKVNQGIWYFCANIVANEKRLETLLNGGIDEMEHELDLMKEFRP